MKRFTRREVVAAGAGAGLLAAAGGSLLGKGGSGRMPVVFLAHGAPPLLDDAGWVAELDGWARSMPRPSAVLMLSAHWDERPIALGATTTVPLVYDFHGFPRRYYEVTYPAPGAPQLAARVRALLGDRPVSQDERRGLDHGAYVPLVAMYPKADVPVLQVSLPGLDPAELLELGKALAPLREEGVLIVGSGFITHNMRAIDTRPGAPVPAWAEDFDAFVEEALRRGEADALVDFESHSKAARIALPTTEHYVPLLVAAGAARDDLRTVRFPITGFWMGSFTRRSVQFG